MAKMALCCGVVCALLVLALAPIDAQPAAGGVISEPRGGGIQKIVVEFDQPVEAADGALDVGDVTVTDSLSNPYTPVSVALVAGGTKLEITFNYLDLPDQKRYTFDVAGKFKSVATGLLLTGDTDCDVRGLVGDITSDGGITLTDVRVVRQYDGQSVDDEITARCDVTVDGTISLTDVRVTRQMDGNSAP